MLTAAHLFITDQCCLVSDSVSRSDSLSSCFLNQIEGQACALSCQELYIGQLADVETVGPDPGSRGQLALSPPSVCCVGSVKAEEMIS